MGSYLARTQITVALFGARICFEIHTCLWKELWFDTEIHSISNHLGNIQFVFQCIASCGLQIVIVDGFKQFDRVP